MELFDKLELMQTSDARKWASEFKQVACNKFRANLDFDWLVTWFASAIMRGADSNALAKDKDTRFLLQVCSWALLNRLQTVDAVTEECDAESDLVASLVKEDAAKIRLLIDSLKKELS